MNTAYISSFHRIIICSCTAALLVLGSISTASAGRKDCSAEADTGARLKCKTENLNDSFDSFTTTISNDNTGTFTAEQKNQIRNIKEHVSNETGRTPPQDFKQMGKKRDLTCHTREIVGDGIGDEDGICTGNEPCAEVVDDGIGDDDGICVDKGKYKEACVQICDPDLVMAEGDETNVDRGRADDMEQALDDVTAVLDESGQAVSTVMRVRSMQAACDQATMSNCEYLGCLVKNGRTLTSDSIEALVGAASAARLLADSIKDIMKWDKLFNCAAVAAISEGIASAVNIAAVTMEVVDDCQTGERIDLLALCIQENGNKAKQVEASLTEIAKLLQLPPGQRLGYPAK